MEGFCNEPDTDFSLAPSLVWAKDIIAHWRPRCDTRAVDIPLMIDGEDIRESRMLRECRDPSRPGVVVGRYREASQIDLDRALDSARHDPSGWRSLTPKRRAAILGEVAQALRRQRGTLMGARRWRTLARPLQSPTRKSPRRSI
jgi:RHH-type proline utilization regulon transcriptional repressor/proline dehydrogenase/delta 1-pyrroline-5-carboxylate dehydrogenase